MKPKIFFLPALLFFLPLLTAAQHDTLEYSVVKGKTISGVQKRWVSGNAYHYFYQFNDRGRGDSLYDDINTDAKGWIIKSSTRGVDYFKQPFTASFELYRDSMISRTNEEKKVKPAGHVFYSGMQAPGSIELLIHAALAEPLHKLLLLSGDTFQVKAMHQKHFSFQEGNKEFILAETYFGNNTPPVFYWLDRQGNFFAAISDWFSTIGRNHEALVDTLFMIQEEQALSYYTSQMKVLSEKLPGHFAIKHVRLYDAEAGVMLEDMTVLTVNGKITEVKSSTSVKISADYEIVDGKGKTLLPGLWDMHGHYDKGEGLAYLAGGVTHVRDMGNGNNLPSIRDAIRRNEILGPDISFISGFIDKAGPLQGPTGAIINNLNEGLSAVDDFARKGYGQIKLYSSIEPAWVKPLADAAHKKGMRVAGHIPAFMTATAAVQAGYDEITHMNMLMLNFLGDTIDTRSPKRFSMVGEYAKDLDLDGKEMTQFVKLLSDNHVVVDPTMHVFNSLFMVHPGDIDPAYLSILAWMPAEKRDQVKATSGFVPEGMKDTYASSYRTMLNTLKKIYDNKVMLVCGTDGGEAISLHHELELYVEAGIPPSKALQTATWNAALDCRLIDKYGSIVAGKEADLILIDGNPGVDIGDIRKVELVIKNNVMYKPKQLLTSIGWNYYY